MLHASALNPCTCGRETCVNPKNKELGSCKVTKETLSQQSSRGFLSSSGDKLAQAFSLGCWSQQDIIHVIQLAKCQLRLKLKVRALVVPMHGAPKEKQEKGVYMTASTWPWPIVKVSIWLPSPQHYSLLSHNSKPSQKPAQPPILFLSWQRSLVDTRISDLIICLYSSKHICERSRGNKNPCCLLKESRVVASNLEASIRRPGQEVTLRTDHISEKPVGLIRFLAIFALTKWKILKGPQTWSGWNFWKLQNISQLSGFVMFLSATVVSLATKIAASGTPVFLHIGTVKLYPSCIYGLYLWFQPLSMPVQK